MLLGRHVRSFPVAEVTSVDTEGEVDPREVGLDHGGVREIWATVERLYETGLHPAISLTVRRHGRMIVNRAIGHLRGNAPDTPASGVHVPIRHDSLFNLFSGTKAVTAMLIHLLEERGLVRLDDRVADYIPDFGKLGKETATIRHVLTHRAGIPAVPGVSINLDLLHRWDELIRILCDAKALQEPGHRPGYHALTGGYVLAEILQRVTGTPVKTFLEREILRPLGFRDFTYGIEPSRVLEVAENAYTGLPPLPPGSWVLERSLGIDLREAISVSNDPRFLTAVVPSGNIIGTAEEACRYFQLLLDEGEQNGVRIFRPSTVRRAVEAISRFSVDAFIGIPVRYGMGFMVGGRFISPYGHDSKNAFGHLGFTNTLAWADPDRDLSACIMTSGKPFLTPGQVPWLMVPRAIARVCGKTPRRRAHTKG